LPFTKPITENELMLNTRGDCGPSLSSRRARASEAPPPEAMNPKPHMDGIVPGE